MKLYLAGPMRGYSLYNFPKFAEVAERLRAKDHTPISPHEMDHMVGVDEYVLTDSDITPQMVRNFFHRDLVLILTEAEGIVCLPNWECSSGAVAEVSLGRVLKLPLYDEWMNELHVELRIRSWNSSMSL
jgi:hypothetical protein